MELGLMPNKRLHLTIASVTLAGELNVRRTGIVLEGEGL